VAFHLKLDTRSQLIKKPTNMAAPNGSASAAPEIPNDGTGVVQLDPWLAPFKDALARRYKKAQDWIKTIDSTEGGLEKFSRVGNPHTELLRVI
jgi:1,4-alpha-glucan branching enzyme